VILKLRSILVAFLCVPLAVAAATYRCQGADGKLGYSDRPCPTTEKTAGTLSSSGARAEAPYVRPAPVEVPPLQKADVSGLQKDAQGRPAVGADPGGTSVALDKSKPGPLQILAACSALVTRCVNPPARSLDACFLSAPRCTSPKPWVEADGNTACCPQACWERYESLRKSGRAPIAALDNALYGSGDSTKSCLPPM